jgi:hypothetical protein
MLMDVEISLIEGSLKRYKHSKRRLLRLKDIAEDDSERELELVDTENYIWAMPLEAKERAKAVLAVSKSRVWLLVSAYLHAARLTPPIPRPSILATHRALVKLRAKRRRNFLSQYDVKESMHQDVVRIRNWLQWA